MTSQLQRALERAATQGAQRPPQGPPYFFVPQGTGLEARALDPSSDGPLDGWQRLWNRIEGSYGARSTALYHLQRSGIQNPDLVVPRWGVVASQVATGPGATPMVWNFDTLTVVTGCRAFLGAGAVPFNYGAFVRAGSDGGYVLGTDRTPVPVAAIWTANADTVPIVCAPMVGRPNNQWTGAIVGVGGAPVLQAVIAFYGVSFWTPDGQIQ